ncbi:hypothetical protein VKT23_008026 [Stygiomarasmius scandens]|uniref:Heterokaryon incompatibility domain-containing protein n=1 Tax=Marasmiellus scandens TaxID=2682957 RepID=A0ABR1JNE1_9AGAR
MRLLNTQSLELKEFNGNIPPYVILSHTWEKDAEVTLQDLIHWHQTGFRFAKSGWWKIHSACTYARKYTFEWIWIDSCCIDKSSSAELSEAINSMYQYYEDAEVCYVHLCDASSQEDPRNPTSAFRSSRWFTRGWTLQELIAPLYAVFLDKEWNEIGTRWSLRDVVSAITSIPVQVFEGHSIDEFSIAQRMSWAAFRETTRPEDEAYCLMGIFNVSMPPIYGEGGTKAFMRLEQEIIKTSDDRSIFAWISTSEDPSEMRGLLARSPKEFRASGGVRASETGSIGDHSSFSFANNGLHIHLPIPIDDSSSGADTSTTLLTSLHCQFEQNGAYNYISIYLKRIGERQYVRCRPHEAVLTPFPPKPRGLKEVIVKESSPPRGAKRKGRGLEHCVFLIKILPSARRLLNFSEIELSNRGPFDTVNHDWNSMTCIVKTGLVRSQNAILFSDDILAQLRLPYSAGQISGVFNVAIRIQNHIEMVAVTPQTFCSISTVDCNVPADRAALHLEEAGLVRIGLRMTGRRSERVIEIGFDHVAEDLKPLDTALLMSPMLRHPDFGFRIPVSIKHPFEDRNFLSLEGIFSPEFLDRGLKPGHCHEIYLCMPVNTDIPFRLLTYKDHWSITSNIYVALGFHGTGEAWTEVFVRKKFYGASDGQEKTREAIKKSYFNSGSWRQASSSAHIVDGARKISASIRESTTLQLGSHSLLLSVELLT